MKTIIYELLGMIKDDIPVKRVLFRNRIYEYDEDGKDYFNEEYGWLLDGYSTLSILNEPVEILETTITYKPDKIEKIDITDKSICVKGTRFFRDKDIEIFQKLSMVINEVIEVINERQS